MSQWWSIYGLIRTEAFKNGNEIVWVSFLVNFCFFSVLSLFPDRGDQAGSSLEFDWVLVAQVLPAFWHQQGEISRCHRFPLQLPRPVFLPRVVRARDLCPVFTGDSHWGAAGDHGGRHPTSVCSLSVCLCPLSTCLFSFSSSFPSLLSVACHSHFEDILSCCLRTSGTLHFYTLNLWTCASLSYLLLLFAVVVW